MAMKCFVRCVWRALLAVVTALGLMAGSAHAAQNVLILATHETAGDAVAANTNVQAEFGAGGASVTYLDTLGTAGAITPATFLTAAGTPYDLVVVMSVYNPIDAGNLSAITTAINSRAANMFAMFIDGCNVCSGNAKMWVPELNKVTAGSMTAGIEYNAFFDSGLNTNSPYASSFAGLNPLAAGYVTLINNVPANNVLYLPDGVIPSAAGSTAFGVFFPATQTGGTSNMGGGACLFGAVDATLMAQQYGSNKDKFAPAVLKAAATPDCAFPSVSKAFSPTSVPLGGTSTLTITLSNPRLVAVGGAQVKDLLPAPLTVGGAATTTCAGGALNAPIGGTTVAMTGGQIPAGTATAPGTCTLTVPVLWPNAPAGKTACQATAEPQNPVTNLINPAPPANQFSTTAGQMGTVASAKLACNPALPPVPPPQATPVPTLGEWALALLVTMLGLLGWRQRPARQG